MTIKAIKLFSMLSLLFLSIAIDAASPKATVENAAEQLLSELKKNQFRLESNPKLVHNLIQRYIIPHVDVTGMSRSVIGRKAWMKATSAQRKRFSHQFVQLIIRTYATGLRNYSGEKVKFLPVRGGENGKRFVKVSSYIIKPNGRNIPLKYSLVRKGESWKVYDVSVEGVSLLQSFHSQFSRELKKGATLNQLIAKISQRQSDRS